MNKKALLFSLFLAVFSASLVFWSICEQNADTDQSNLGSLFFEETAKDGLNVNKIIVKMPQQQVTLSLEGKFWRVKEADGYFAGLVVTNGLFNALNEAKIHSVIQKEITPEMQLAYPESKETPDAGISIQIFNKTGAKIDDVIIGAETDGYHYARHANSSTPVLISGNFNLPQRLDYWLQQPLITLSEHSVETVITQSETEQQLAFRPEPTLPFHDINRKEINISAFLEQFVSLNFTSVKTADNTPLKDELPKKAIVLFMESGLIYGIEVYEYDDSYWVRINLSTTSLPTKLASDYIKDSSFLYKDWFFKIDNSIGRFLVQYMIH